jgi:hypothetical protein
MGGKVLFQSDITNFLGVAHEIIQYRAKFHNEPLWTNSMFGGMPAYQVSTEYHANLILYFHRILLDYIPFPVNIVFLYCLGFYILLKVLNINNWVAVAGSFAFAFSSYFFIILAVGHNSKAGAIGFMAPVLAGVILTFSGKRLEGAALMGISLAMELFSDHLQITYYLMLTILIYCLAQLITAFKQKQLAGFFKNAVILVIAAMLAIGTNITNLWLTNDYSKYSNRGKSDLTGQETSSNGMSNEDYANQWSYGITETMTLLIPNYKGGVSEPIAEKNRDLLSGLDEQHQEAVGNFEQYWGDQPFTQGPVYIGAIVCFFALLGFIIIKGPIKWFVFFAALLSIMLSWGKYFEGFTGLFFHYFPFYNKFRSVSMILVIAELVLPLLAALAIDRIIKSKDFFKEKVSLPFFDKPLEGGKIFFSCLIFLGGLTLIFYLIPGVITDFTKPNEVGETIQMYREQNPKVDVSQIKAYLDEIMPSVEAVRKKIFTADAGRSFLFIILAAGLVWVYDKKYIKGQLFAGVLTFFILMDLPNVDLRYLNKTNFKSKHAESTPFEPDAADQQILTDTTLDYRVYNTTIRPDQDGRTSYFHKSIGGYSAIKMKRYNELLTYQIERGNVEALDMLNTKYVIVGNKQGENQAERNPGALGNAWFVNNVKIVPSADSVMGALSHFNAATTAIVENKYADYLKGVTLSSDSTSKIRLNSYEPNDLVYSSNANSTRLAVFSEIYYKDGWDAFIDGKPADYICVNYVLRAMLIPAGTHTIEFKFEPKEYAIGEKISLASSLILILGCISLLVYGMKGKNK